MWTVTNEEVLKRARETLAPLRTIERRQLSFLGHVIRKECLEELSLAGKIDGKRARGGQRTTFPPKFHPWKRASSLEKSKEQV